MQFIAEKSRTKNITTCLVIPSLLKKYTYQVGTKIVLPRVLSRHASRVNNPLGAVNTRNGTSQKKPRRGGFYPASVEIPGGTILCLKTKIIRRLAKSAR